jgi:transcriptional regulator with GAF, ATPase, and Fis domain
MHLLARNGSLAGMTITLADGLTLSPADGAAAVCRVRAADGGSFVLEPLQQDAPIFINGLPLTARTLVERDDIRIGDSLFIVRTDEAHATSPLVPCTVSEGTAVDRETFIKVALELTASHWPLAYGSSRDDDASAALFGAAVTLSQVRGLASLDPAVAGLILDAVPVRRVAFADGDGASATVRSAWSVAEDSPRVMPIDARRLATAMSERAGVIVNMDGANVLVAPMMAFGRATGVVWAEAGRGVDLDERHLGLLLVIAALAAVAREQAHEAARLEDTNERLRAEINLEHNMVGASRPMRQLFDRIARVARTESTMLVRGESGTGKELVARAAHRNSPRADRPFIAINCAALTETLLESELFGHEKGAFTGAIGLKKGKLELADGGTLFLDEIGELPLPLQAKLLRALQEREFERVGGTRPVKVDFRLIAATNRDLEEAVSSGAFRQDLFYRLNVVMLVLPPLRDRKEDIPALADYFVRKHAARSGRRVHGMHPDALSRLVKYDWPGNVRELENVIEQALALGVSDRIVGDDLPASLTKASRKPGTLNYHETVEGTKRDLILRAFEQADHNHTAAARLLGVHPNYLHRLLRNFDLRRTLSESAGNPD